MATVVIPGPTILAGQSLSDPIDCTIGTLVRILVPPDWTPANLSFQIEGDGTTGFHNVADPAGREFIIHCGPGAAIAVANSAFKNCLIKLRSGSSQFPVEQEADRNFAVVVLTDPPPTP